jgi:predicted ATPase/class 3 adenylate cyclase/Tfp pilus assembly protein PilF
MPAFARSPFESELWQRHSHALLVTDIVDSTNVSQALGDIAMTRHWTAHDRAARDLLPRWAGREIDKADGMLLLFDTAANAAGYAADYHRAISELGLPFKARAGLHVGPVTQRINSAADVALGAKPIEIEGLAKSVVARLMSIAVGGQTLVSAEARRTLGETPLRVQSHGHWRISGLADPVELFEVGGDDAPFVPPPDAPKAYRVVPQGDLWTPVREIRHSMPSERDCFVGRQQALRSLADLLHEGARLVSVLGVGGSGKTRLAVRFGRTWMGDYPGGVWFCDLSQARDIDGIAAAVAQSLGIALGRTDPVVQLAHAMAGRDRCLVILDNFEQVASLAEATLGRWLERAASARFLVTTRERLGIIGEQTLDLPPLPPDDATTLFMSRVEAVRRGYEASVDDRATIMQLVRMLDGLPLAIELAAARLRVMSPRTMLACMHERFAVLKSRTGRGDRQATLRAAFDWSWELLAETEKAALAQLSVFRGGFTIESAEKVLNLPAPDHAHAVIDTIQALLDKSFVRALGKNRFDLLESVREYASEHLRTPGRFVGSGARAGAAAEQRHGEHFGGLGPGRAVERSCVELDNLVVACRRAAARHDANVAVRTLAAAWRAIEMQGPFRLGAELARSVKAIPGLDGRATVEVDLITGAALQMSGHTVQAKAALDAAASGARAAGEPVLEGRALKLLATVQARSGEIEEAAASFDRALAVVRATGDRTRECALLNALGAFCESQGNSKDARQHYEAGVRVAREVGDRRWEGGSAGNLGQFHANQGRPAEARPLYEHAVLIARELGDRQWEANARCNLGLLHFAEGRLPDARTELKAALATTLETGHVHVSSVIQCNLGLVAEALGERDAAFAHLEGAVTLARDSGDHRSEGQFLGYLGLLHARHGGAARARECLVAGEALLRRVADRISLGILLCARAEAEHRCGNDRAADAALAAARQLADDVAEVEPNSEFGQALSKAGALRPALV